jgi:hypothetical protein
MKRLTLAALVLQLQLPFAAWAQTGVSDDRVSLPEGPGSLEGVGESVRPNLNMGTMSWSLPIPVPRGFPGVTPELGLRYDSGAGSGAVGIGWSMDVPSIERLTLRGLPEYDTDDEFTADGAQLVRVSQNPAVYRARDERGFVRYTWMNAGDGAAGYWLAEYPDGRKGYFGADRDGRLVGAARHEAAGRTFRYALVDMVDVFGHRLHCTYQRDAAAPDQVGASLLLAVDYVFAQGDDADSTYQVAFGYEPSSDPTGQSVISDAKPGFDVRTTSRLREVSVFARGQRIRRMRLSYEPYAEAGGFTRLSRVETLGQRDGVYPVRFDFAYSQALGGQCEDAGCLRPYMVDMGDVDLDPTSGQATFVDINGDGLPDLLHAPPNGNHRFFLNVPDPDGGSAFDAPVQSNFGGQQFQLTSGRVQPLDVDGDGFCDLLNTRTAEVLYNRGLGDWAEAGNLLDVGALANLDADFPLGYRGPEAGDADVADGDATDGYWRSCVRNRDASWDVDPGGNGAQAGLQQRSGFDFAQYSCGADRRNGTCAVPPPVARLPEGPFERPPVHGVCDTPLADRAPDLPWMGMNHHSQFKCVRAVDPIAAQDRRVRPYEHPFNAFFSLNDVPETAVDDRQNPLTLHQCALTPAAPGTPASVSCSALDGQAVRRQDVGFASVRYVDTSATGIYTRGCIDEWKPAPVDSPRNEPADVDAWRDLCPGHQENPIGVVGAGNPSAFGRLSCGCTSHTGGAYCEIPCADALFAGDNPGVAGCDPATGYCPFGTADRDHRVGLWMCGGVTTTSVADEDPEAPPYLENTTPEGTTWRLRQGGFPAVIRAEYMQENAGDPNAGWRLR